MRVKMIVAYDGTNYCGWQIQPNGITIEQVLNEHLSRLLKEDIKVTGASRTDAGVHSLGNVCMFDTNTRMPAEKISEAEAPSALPPRTKYQKSSSSTAPAAVTIRWMAVDCTRLSLNAFKKLLYICDSLSSAILRVI